MSLGLDDIDDIGLVHPHFTPLERGQLHGSGAILRIRVVLALLISAVVLPRTPTKTARSRETLSPSDRHLVIRKSQRKVLHLTPQNYSNCDVHPS